VKRILIFGNSGSGKSTIAKKLCEAKGLAHLDLDTLAWQHTVPPQRKPLDESLISIQNFIDVNQGWVVEGCYADLLEQLLPFCDEIVFMNLPIAACIANAIQRPWEPHKYESKEAQDANLEMLMEWIKQYDQRADEFSYSAHRRLFDDFAGQKREVCSNE
jgi:adenylate kinase family enzyme